MRKRGKDYYAKIGRIGGSAIATKPKGFAANPELARIAGAKGGKISKRGKSAKPKTPDIDHGVTGIKRPRKLLARIIRSTDE